MNTIKWCSFIMNNDLTRGQKISEDSDQLVSEADLNSYLFQKSIESLKKIIYTVVCLLVPLTL